MIKKNQQLLIILILSVFLGLFRYSLLEDKFPLFYIDSSDKENSTKIIDSSLQDFLLDLTEPELISIDVAKSIFDSEIGIFIDAREEKDFKLGHIKGSINLPFDVDNNYKFDLVDSLLNEISYNDKSLVVYCSGNGCTLGQDLVYYLFEEQNFYSLTFFEEGYPVWEKMNFPIKKSEDLNNSIDDELTFELSNLDLFVIFSLIVLISIYFIYGFNSLIIIYSRLIVGFIFIYFSYDKIIDPFTFANLTSNYDVIPFNLEYLGALVLPWIEMIVGICLILGIFLEVNLSLTISMLVFFIFMLMQAYVRGKSIDCGCLLADLNSSSALEKQINMLKRIVHDLYFLVLTLIVKYRKKLVNKDD